MSQPHYIRVPARVYIDSDFLGLPLPEIDHYRVIVDIEIRRFERVSSTNTLGICSWSSIPLNCSGTPLEMRFGRIIYCRYILIFAYARAYLRISALLHYIRVRVRVYIDSDFLGWKFFLRFWCVKFFGIA